MNDVTRNSTARFTGPHLIRKLPVWAWAFILHEALMFLALVSPMSKPPLALLTKAEQFSSMAHFLFQWDTLWVTAIARYGYGHLPEGQPLQGTAFFPWLPTLIHVFGVWTTWGLTQVALATSLWLLQRIFLRMLTPGQSTLAVLLFALNPASIYFSTLYAEPWTVLFTLLSVELGYRQRWSLAGVTGALAATTQAAGVLVGLFPLVGFLASVVQQQWRRGVQYLVWGVSCFLGIASYATYLGVRFHNFLLFSSVEHTSWQQEWTMPWHQFLTLAVAMLHGPVYYVQIFLWLASIIFVIGMLRLYGPRVLGHRETGAAVLYGTVGIGLALCFTDPQFPFHSTVRIASVYYPLYAGISLFPKWLGWSVLIFFEFLALLGAILFTHQWFYQ